MKENSIEELKQRLEELYKTQQARLDVGADDLDIREAIAEVEEKIKELQDDTNVDREYNIKNERSSIEEDIKTVNNFITYFNKNIQKGYMADLTVLGEEIEAIEHILSDYKRVLKETERYKNMYKAEHEIHLVRNEQLSRKEKAVTKCNKLIIENAKLQKENEELKNNGVIDENEFEFAVDCDWDRLKKLIDAADKSEEFILYDNEKWIKEKYCIPVQKIKDKIEELDIAILECEYSDDDDELYKKAVKEDKVYLLNQKRVLKEILKEEDRYVKNKR